MKNLSLLFIGIFGAIYMFAAEKDEKAATQLQKPSLVGNWASVLNLNFGGPAQITTITINEDGSYHWLTIEAQLKNTGKEDPKSYLPEELKLQLHSTGWIDLETGQERISAEHREGSVYSVQWTVEDGELHWDKDMGPMGGEGLTFSRVSH